MVCSLMSHIMSTVNETTRPDTRRDTQGPRRCPNTRRPTGGSCSDQAPDSDVLVVGSCPAHDESLADSTSRRRLLRNPLFAVAIVEDLIRRGQAQFHGLGSDERAILARASVADVTFAPWTVARAVGRDVEDVEGSRNNWSDRTCS